MREGNVVVGDVVEEVDLILFEKETCSDRVDGSISPPLVEKPTVFVETVEEVDVRLRSEPVEVADLEIRPLDRNN